ERVFKFLWIASQEIYTCIRTENFPVWRYCGVGIIFSYYLLFDLDIKLAQFFDSEFYLEPNSYKLALTLFTAASGLIFFGFEKASSRMKLTNRLQKAFDYCDLKSGGLYPSFIKDEPIDEYVRQMKIFVPGIPLQRFKDKKIELEAHFNVNIVKMFEEENDKTRINMVYSMRDLPTSLLLENAENYVDGDIPIGLGYGTEIKINLKDMGHMLVAGQTGGGKSNFLKTVTSILCFNNTDADVHFLDFKEGIEMMALKNKLGSTQKNFHTKDGPEKSIEYLGGLIEVLTTRLNEIKRSGAINFDEYLKKQVGAVPQVNTEIKSAVQNKVEKLKRLFIVIDEVAEVYVKSPVSTTERKTKAREAINKIARQGRAAGVHLIVATQKPDSQSFDQTVKTNMPAILCFPMPSQAASVSVLGTKRAFDLNPEIKGRAIYKFGPALHEVQTYYFQ
ncbi:MAG: hypothetical protein H7235_06630, partial [Bdellovibrionaceae bacterium]|nr:hypothetical protein [Pseudobdellovibrionaceae bacterium]